MEFLGQTRSSTYIACPDLIEKDIKNTTKNQNNFNSSYNSLNKFQGRNQSDNGITKNYISNDYTYIPNNWDSNKNYLTNENPSFDYKPPANSFQNSDKESKLGLLSSLKVTTDFSKIREAIPMKQKFEMKDWSRSNSNNYLAVNRIRAASELTRFEGLRVGEDTYEIVRKNQEESTKNLADRSKEVQLWKDQVDEEFNLLGADNKNLKKIIYFVNKALAETREPLEIVMICLKEREKRSGVDLVQDDVEQELLREIENIKQIQNELNNQLSEMENQIESNKIIEKKLNDNSNEKFLAINLDNLSCKLKNTSKGLQNYKNFEKSNTTLSDTDSWLKSTCDIIKSSQNQRAQTKFVIDLSSELLQRHSDSLIKQWNKVNEAFDYRIQDYFNAKDKLEKHLKEILKEISECQKHIEFAKKNLKDKALPLKVAQTRLFIRSERPNMEVCNDNPNKKLGKELKKLEGTEEDLTSTLRKLEFSEQHLQRTKRAIEEDLVIKNNSLLIDKQRCMGWRKAYIMSPRSFCIL